MLYQFYYNQAHLHDEFPEPFENSFWETYDSEDGYIDADNATCLNWLDFYQVGVGACIDKYYYTWSSKLLER